jgi:4-alpha-glucanotransferase
MTLSSIEQFLQSTPAASHWQRIGIFHHSGILIPLSAIHTANSCGVGEFLDLIPLIDWCHSIGFDIIQLLPLNNAPHESSPYTCESSCALNPLYISLSALEGTCPTELRDLQKLTQLCRVEHAKVAQAKLQFLRDYYTLHFQQISDQTSYQQFAHIAWLKPYALFKALQSKFQGRSWKEWPQEFTHLNDKEREALYPQYSQEMHWHMFLQYLCFTQLKQVHAYAKTQKCLLMGDLPILLSQESADHWQSPHYFDPALGAGAPPDPYNDQGQNWNLPLFNWEAMRNDHFSWWRQRLEYAQEFYDLFRIDHILGFFRFFAIPFGRPSIEGRYIPQDKKIGIAHAEEILTALLSFTSMLPIGEDFGAEPKYVRPYLKQWGICGTRVMRWEQETPPDQYEPLTLCSVSTHDSEPLSLFWQLYPEAAKALCAEKGWSYTPSLSAMQRKEILKECHHSQSLFHINLLQEYLGLFPELCHHNPQDERINIPGKVLDTNWTYRYVPSVETLSKHALLEQAMRGLLQRQKTDCFDS